MTIKKHYFNPTQMIVSLLSIIILVSLLFSHTAYAADSEATNEYSLNPTLYEKYENYSKTISEQCEYLYTILKDADSNYNNNSFQGISNIKMLRDLSGNNYILAEFNNYGYIIIDIFTNSCIEGSLTSPSPYNDLTTDLYYFGPNQYYFKKNNIFYYTHDQSPATTKNISSLVANSNMIHSEIIKNHKESQSQTAKASTNASWAYVNGYQYFQNLRSCGYCEVNSAGQKVSSGGSGICGYIAAGMLLSFDTVMNSRNYVSSSYLSSDGTHYSIKSTFPYALYRLGKSLGYSTDTTSVAIHYTIEEYMSLRNINVSHVSYYVPFANNVTVTSYLLDDRPVIWFGNYSGVGNHAVVIYGVLIQGSAYSFMAHMGYDNQNSVYVNGIIGSMYTYTY